jgi:hypothetical protein
MSHFSRPTSFGDIETMLMLSQMGVKNIKCVMPGCVTFGFEDDDMSPSELHKPWGPTGDPAGYWTHKIKKHMMPPPPPPQHYHSKRKPKTIPIPKK